MRWLLLALLLLAFGCSKPPASKPVVTTTSGPAPIAPPPKISTIKEMFEGPDLLPMLKRLNSLAGKEALPDENLEGVVSIMKKLKFGDVQRGPVRLTKDGKLVEVLLSAEKVGPDNYEVLLAHPNHDVVKWAEPKFRKPGKN